jgi:hypothetical protein
MNPAPIPQGDIYAACREFVLSYALPALDPDKVIQGWQNRAVLPPESNDYAVISIVWDSQRGTALETFRADDPDPTQSGLITLKALFEVQAQVDICAENDTARQRARHLALAARSGLGVQFFNERGLSILYADDVRDLSFVGEARQFVRRYMTTLHLSAWTGIRAEYDYFDGVRVSRVENVDTQHKP